MPDKLTDNLSNKYPNLANELSDSEIIKALDICSKSTNGCSHSKYTCEDCYLNGQPMCSSVLLQDAIDLHARQQAEIEMLKKGKDEYAYLYDKHINTAFSHIKTEAIKEFAERLKTEIDIRPTHSKKQNEYVFFLIDNLVKEMVGDDNA